MLETKTFRGLPFSLSPALTEKVWNFQSESTQIQQLFLSPSGRIKEPDSSNAWLWRIENHQLLILANDGDLAWQSTGMDYRDDGRLVIFLETPKHDLYAILEEQAPSSKPLLPEKTTDSALPTQSMESTELEDSEFIFPSNLEIVPTKVKKVLIIGSSIGALCHEQLTQQYLDIRFDFIPYEFVAPLPTALPIPLEDYDFVYLQPSLRSILGDDIIWGARFNTPNFAQNILTNAQETLKNFIQHVLDYAALSDTPLLVSNFLTPQIPPRPFSRDRGVDMSVSTIIQTLNILLSTELDNHPLIKILDIEAVTSIVGKRYIQDDTIYFNTHNGIIFQDWDDFGPFEQGGPLPDLQTIYPNKHNTIGTLLFRQMIWGLRTLCQTDCVKTVIFSLDNTIWRGKLSEDASGGQTLPMPRQDGWPMGIWEAIQYLRGRGIKVCLYADGNEADIQALWDKIIEPKFLALEDFDYVAINSAPISNIIPDICSKFSVQPAEIVLVDASAIRRAAITETFPDIRTIGKNPYLTRRILLWAAETQANFKQTLPHKTEKLETPPASSAVMQAPVSNFTPQSLKMLQFMECKVSPHKIISSDDKLLESLPSLIKNSLTSKAEDVNITQETVNSFTSIDSKKMLLIFSVKDRFADYGPSAAIFIDDHAINRFILSARVHGMGTENFMLSEAAQLIRNQFGEGDITISLPITSNISLFRNMYAQAGFLPKDHKDGTEVFYLPAGLLPPTSPHVS